MTPLRAPTADTARPRVIVTRPAREAGQWVTQLQEHLIHAQALPLIHIGPCQAPAHQTALHHATQRLAEGAFHAVMFVSGNAVHQFFEQNTGFPCIPIDFTATKTRAWSPGPGTAKVLQQWGVPPALIDTPAADAPQFDSESLWQTVCPQITAGCEVLIVRGATGDGVLQPQGLGRDWLREQIVQAGGLVDAVVAYERSKPVWNAAQCEQARALASDGSWWLLSSSEAVHHLLQLLPEQSWAHARAIVTHPRIADAARAAGFGAVRECRPALTDVVASIESAA